MTTTLHAIELARNQGGGACPQAPWDFGFDRLDGFGRPTRAAEDSRTHPVAAVVPTATDGRFSAKEQRRTRAFTLVEILLVLALMALFAAIFIPGVNSMLREIDSRGPDQVLSEAMLGAREEALSGGRAVDLRYDTEKRIFSWGSLGRRTEALPLGMSVELLPMEAGGSILLGGELTEAQEPLRRVRFFPDGTCDAFRVRLREATLPPRLFVVDPWTCSASRVEPRGGR